MQFKFVQYHDHGRYSGGNLHGDDECQLRICLTHHGRHAGGAITHGELIVYGDRFRTATAVLSANDKAKVTDRLQRETVTSGSDGVAPAGYTKGGRLREELAHTWTQSSQ